MSINKYRMKNGNLNKGDLKMLRIEHYKSSVKNDIIIIIILCLLSCLFAFIWTRIHYSFMPAKHEIIIPQKKRSDLTIECGRKMIIRNMVKTIAKQHNVDHHLVLAILETESDYRPNVISNKGAMGLMQIMPLIASTYNVDNPFDPYQNIQAGTQYIKYLLEKFDGDIIKTVAAYNAGETKVRRLGRVPRFKETLNYVGKVCSLYEKYSGQSESKKG